MMDMTERGYAAEIEADCPVSHLPQPLHPKTELYGRLAREVLKPISLDTVAVNMQGFRGKTLKTLTARLNNELHQQAEAARLAADTERLDDLFTVRYLGSDCAGAKLSMSQERITTGVNAATRVEEMALMTLKHRVTDSDDAITWAGARASQRVPFALALLTVGGLDPTFGRITRQLPLSECVGETGRVLIEDVYRLHSRRGLMLTREFERHVVDLGSPEPHLGCPATLLARFIRRFHYIAVDAAVRNGIIPVAD